LPSDIQSKESTLQVVYDVLRNCPFFKAFLVTADVPKIYMQEFWATVYVHQHSIRFKLDNKKHIVDLETFRDMLHICPRIPDQSFDELPFEAEILEFFRFLRHSAQIRTLTDVNNNKLFHPWRSFGAVINKCLTRKSSGFDSFRLSQAQILWGLYHSRNIDYAFLIWEDFVYQVEHKNHKKSNEMYYLRFTKVIVHHFMLKDLSIPRQNKLNWHYVRDDNIFSTIKVVSRHQNTQKYGAILPIELTNEDIRNTKDYKEYYAYASGEAAPKPKASARRKRGGSDSSTTPPTVVASPRPTISAVTPRLTAAAKGKQPAKAKSPSDTSELARTEAQQLNIVLRRSRQETHISQHGSSGTNEGTSSKPGVPDVPSDDSEEEISWNTSVDEETDTQEQDRHDDEGDEKDESDDGEEDDGAERDDDDDDDDEEEIAKIDEPKDTKCGGGDDKETESDEESDEEETREEEEESCDPIPRTPKDSEDDGNGEEDQGLRGRGLQLFVDIEDSHVTLTPVNPDGQQESSSMSSQFVSSMLNPTSDAGMESIFATASSLMAPLQTTTPIMTPSTIATITIISHALIPPTIIPSEVLQNLPTFDSVFRFEDRLKSLEITEAVREAVQIQTDRLRDSYQRENDEFLRTIDDNIKRIIKEQVKSQVKEQVSRILPIIEESVNAQLEAEVLTRSSHSSRTSYAVAADLSEMELNKILIEKMEGIKRREDDDDQEGPSAGSDRGSKRRREGGELESARAPLEPATRSTGRSTTGYKSRQASASESAFAEEPVQTTSQIEEPSHPVFETGAEDQPIVQTSQHPEWFPQPKKPPTPDHDWNKTLPAVQGSA
nr:hypothetical protein [Tanacetum cinerariifolium]